jgi:hypothetical protein
VKNLAHPVFKKRSLVGTLEILHQMADMASLALLAGEALRMARKDKGLLQRVDSVQERTGCHKELQPKLETGTDSERLDAVALEHGFDLIGTL